MENVMGQPSSAGTKIVEMRRGAYWFFGIAILGVINSLAVTFGGMANMLFGLGATRVVRARREVHVVMAGAAGVP